MLEILSGYLVISGLDSLICPDGSRSIMMQKRHEIVHMRTFWLLDMEDSSGSCLIMPASYPFDAT